MRIKLDVEIPNWTKWLVAGIGIGIFIGGGAVVLAGVTNVPHTFVDGDTLSAAKLNENFKALQDDINAQRHGIQDWDPAITYPLGSLVKQPERTDLYYSKTNGNLNNALTDRTKWGVYLSGDLGAHDRAFRKASYTIPTSPGEYLVELDGSSFSSSGELNTSSHSWTAASKGTYRITLNLVIGGGVSGQGGYLANIVPTNGRTASGAFMRMSTEKSGTCVSDIFSLDAGESVHFSVTAGDSGGPAIVGGEYGGTYATFEKIRGYDD